MISHKLKCVHIHIHKTGGCSVAKAFGEPPVHFRATEAQAVLGSSWGDYFRWTTVRNPWDRFLSIYHFRRARRHGEFKHGLLDFNDWLRINLVTMPFERRVSQLSWIEDNQGREVALDFIARFETLTQDFEYVKKQTGLKTNLPHINKSQHEHYTQYYTPELVDLVYDVCRRDVERFGYRFDRPALL